MAELTPDWRGFIATVEGRQSPTSTVLRDGKPVFCSDAIPRGAEPNLRLLADLLRADVPVPPEVREWMADLFDDRARSAYQVKVLSRRRRGREEIPPGAHWRAAERFRELCEQGLNRKRAFALVENEFGIKESTIEAALSELTAAEEAHDRATREE